MALVAEGKDAWNEWAGANPDAKANFTGVEFDRDVTFEGFHFTGDANFSGATFTGSANFNDATFTGSANFDRVTFTGVAFFDRVTFTGVAFFDRVTFTSDGFFIDATFAGTTTFSDAIFTGIAAFCQATFTGVAFISEATFTGIAEFDSINVENKISFDDVEFHNIPDFSAAKNPERIELDTVKFSLSELSSRLSKLVHWATGLAGSDRSTMVRIRHIRGIANKNHAVDAERDLTILERNAQVGCAWTSLKKTHPFNKEWWRSLSTVLSSTPLLLAYRWFSNYGRSVVLPLLWLLASGFIWYAIYLKFYISTGRPLSSLNLSALSDIARSGMLPVGTVLRPSYIAAIETLFGKDAGIPSGFQYALLLQNLSSLIFLFLIGLALRNFFRIK